MDYKEQTDKLEPKDLCYLEVLEKIAGSIEKRNELLEQVHTELLIIVRYLQRT